MTIEKQRQVAEHVLWGRLPWWHYSKTFRLLHCCVAVAMSLGILTLVAWPWTGRWLPAWTNSIAAVALLAGAIWGTFVFFAAVVFQRRTA